MANDHAIRRYRHWYAKLVRLYSRAHYERFAEGMEQTFNDLLRECVAQKRGLLGCALGMFAETTVGIAKERTRIMFTQNKRFIAMTAGVVALLLIPFLAMQFGGDVDWSPFDFGAAAVLLFGAVFSFEILARMRGGAAYRAGAGLAVAATLFLVVMNGAVGIIGSENNPANLLYGGVITIGFVGAIIARLQPQGMARTLFAVALAQVLVPIVALIVGEPLVSSWGAAGVFGVFVLNAFFVLLFVVSALLFRRAGQTGTPAPAV